MIKRLVALGALVAALVGLLAAPASAHASVISIEPTSGGVYETPPKAVTLRFTEGIEASLGGIRVYDSQRQRLVAGAPEHPNDQQSVVRSRLPKLADGTYVVTWRVTSADSHPISGAYTFQVGSKATLSDRSAKSTAASLLAVTGGSRTVGVIYGIDRAVLFAGLALLIGGAVFLAVVWPAGRDDRRARRLLWGGWITVFVTTVLGIAFEGVYTAGLPLGDIVDTTVLRDVLDTRYARIALIRLGLLVLAIPLLRLLLRRRPATEHPLRWWWYGSAAVLGAGLAMTPGIAGHASSGIQIGLAIPADLVHMLAMSTWLGGLVVLCVAVLPRRSVEELRRVLPRYSTLALGAIVVLVVSGGYQTWRQVGSFDELKSTDFGRLLIAKLVAFAVLIVAAAFSREVVNRRFRSRPPDDDEVVAAEDPVLVGVGAPVPSGGAGDGHDADGHDADGHDAIDQAGDDDLEDEDDLEDADELTRLRRSVWVEVVIAVGILAITALIVNAAPARSESSGPLTVTLKGDLAWVYVNIAPGVAGPNDMHFTAYPTGGGPATVTGMTVQFTRPGEDLAPFTVPLQQLSGNHYYSPQFEIPYSGNWRATVRVQLGGSQEALLTGPFTVR